MVESEPNNFFPKIGQVAEKTNALEDKDFPEQSNEEDEDRAVEEIGSLCMSCGEQGVTKLLLTTIPYFKEVIIMSFRCEHCGTSNNEIQSAGSIRPEGAVYTARIQNREDLNRQLVKSASCSVTIPQYELTIPPARGQLTTIEGLLRDIVTDLSAGQPLRKYQDENAYTKIQSIIDRARAILGDEEEDEEVTGPKDPRERTDIFTPFTVQLDDPAGNSFIEFLGSTADPKWNLRTYVRTHAQDVALGISAPDDVDVESNRDAIKRMKETLDKVVADQSGGEIKDDEIFVFPGSCSSCHQPLDTLMKKVNIPYFQDIFIMSTNCDACGYRDNEVKSGSAISEKGKRIILKVEDREDLSRDILKSETCGLSIPDIDLVLQAGTLGGRFTTLEGILDQVFEELSEKVFAGDSADSDDRSKFGKFLSDLKAVKNAERPFTLILDDPLANSYLQNLYAPDPDPNMETVMYDRSWEQNEELGLNDIKVENYSADS
ncbi:zf-ZPR1-domain-containing protein [Thelephora terrestris]|uniref:Zf-ZPR1-domain-containing protein n=1 Tax=Thelephora terrestris TaxID=56493 RepID=A0A9P6HE31_9AGAM|nr:zf-ZPR1-domain-containing protein [Thelephora terrestris]